MDTRAPRPSLLHWRDSWHAGLSTWKNHVLRAFSILGQYQRRRQVGCYDRSVILRRTIESCSFLPLLWATIIIEWKKFHFQLAHSNWLQTSSSNQLQLLSETKWRACGLQLADRNFFWYESIKVYSILTPNSRLYVGLQVLTIRVGIAPLLRD